MRAATDREAAALYVTGMRNAIDALDNEVPASVQSEMLIEVGRLVLRSTLWFLRRRAERRKISRVLDFFAPGVAAVSQRLPALLSNEDMAAVNGAEARLTQQGVPAPLASAVARQDAMYSVLDIVEVSEEKKRPIDLAAAVYFSLVGKLGLRWVAGQIAALPAESHWQAMARAAMRDDLANLQRQRAAGVLALSPNLSDKDTLLAAWEEHHSKALARMREVMADLKQARESDLAMLSVLLRELRVLA